MLLLLVGFKCVEEVIRAWLHGETVGMVLAEFLELSLIQILTPLLLMLLILIPLVAVSEITRLIGEERLLQLLTRH